MGYPGLAPGQPVLLPASLYQGLRAGFFWGKLRDKKVSGGSLGEQREAVAQRPWPGMSVAGCCGPSRVQTCPRTWKPSLSAGRSCLRCQTRGAAFAPEGGRDRWLQTTPAGRGGGGTQTEGVLGAPAVPLQVCDSELSLRGILGSVWRGADVAGAVLGFANVSCSRLHLRGWRGGWFATGIDELWEANPREVGKKRGFAWPWQLLRNSRYCRASFPGTSRRTPSWASPPHGRGLFPLPRPSAAASDKVGQALGRARHRGSPGPRSRSRGWRKDALEGSGQEAGGLFIWGGVPLSWRQQWRDRSRGLCPWGICCSFSLPLGWGGLDVFETLLPCPGVSVVFGGI